MKKSIIISALLFFAYQYATGQPTLSGTWEIVHFVSESLNDSRVLTREMLEADGSVWEMTFHGDGSFQQQANLNSRKEMDSREGTWAKATDERLVVHLPHQGKMQPISYFYEFSSDTLVLERYNPMRTARLVLKFVRSSD